jgi:peptidoglycan/xylan/chitin deacetylase (PgdA/CDA1 family)
MIPPGLSFAQPSRARIVPRPMTLRSIFLLLATLLSSLAQEITPSPSPPPVEESTATDDGIRVSILGYHDFSETESETAMRIRTSKFRKQMEVLRQLGLTVISLDDFLAWKRGEKEIPAKSVMITIDDGWKSTYTDAHPILKEFGYPYTIYLYKNYVDGGGKALTTPMIEEMIKNGATIGSHSVSHPYPATVKSHRKKSEQAYDAFLRIEMGESKRFLEAKFKQTITTYAYPGGYFTEEMLTLAEEFGYTHLFTVQPGKVKQSHPDNMIPRYMILGNYDRIFEFATAFRETGTITTPEGTISGLTETTPHPVSPEPGSIINSRTPLISADLSKVTDLDPKTLSMKIGGLGEVPAVFDPTTGRYAWEINRRLRQPLCQVSITWKNTDGKSPDAPLRWTFRIDLEAAYLPDGQ